MILLSSNIFQRVWVVKSSACLQKWAAKGLASTFSKVWQAWVRTIRASFFRMFPQHSFSQFVSEMASKQIISSLILKTLSFSNNKNQFLTSMPKNKNQRLNWQNMKIKSPLNLCSIIVLPISQYLNSWGWFKIFIRWTQYTTCPYALWSKKFIVTNHSSISLRYSQPKPLKKKWVWLLSTWKL